MNRIKALLVDDDPFIHDLMEDKLTFHFPQIELVGMASSGQEGLRMIREFSPDLVFLDVEMKDMTGFGMLKLLREIQFETIFVTSYSHYAIKAIKFNALDYLLKPIDLESLASAIQRFEKRRDKRNQDRIRVALDNIHNRAPQDQIFVLQMQEGELRVPVSNMIRIEGERNYSSIVMKAGKRKLSSKPLGEFEELLSDKGFFRCHKSHIINFAHISSVSSQGIRLTTGEEIPVSRRKKKEFETWFRQNQKVE